MMFISKKFGLKFYFCIEYRNNKILIQYQNQFVQVRIEAVIFKDIFENILKSIQF